MQPTPVGFKPTRGDPIGLAGRRPNHSAKVSLHCAPGASAPPASGSDQKKCAQAPWVHISQRLRQRAHGVVVSHPLCMRKALGSIPSVSTFLTTASCTRQPARGKPQLNALERVPHRQRWREPSTSARGSSAASVAHAPGLHHCSFGAKPIPSHIKRRRGMKTSCWRASLGQLAEHALRKRMVMGSIPIGGSFAHPGSAGLAPACAKAGAAASVGTKRQRKARTGRNTQTMHPPWGSNPRPQS